MFVYSNIGASTALENTNISRLPGI